VESPDGSRQEYRQRSGQIIACVYGMTRVLALREQYVPDLQNEFEKVKEEMGVIAERRARELESTELADARMAKLRLGAYDRGVKYTEQKMILGRNRQELAQKQKAARIAKADAAKADKSIAAAGLAPKPSPRKPSQYH